MGLAQKRIISEYKDKEFEKWQKQIHKTVGFNIPIDVKWDTMQSDDYTDRDQYFQWYEMVYFKPLVQALEEVCKDKMGKDAVKEGVKKIVIDGSEGYYPEHTKFDSGVLTIKHKFNTNVDHMSERAKVWQKLLEDKLG